MTTADQPVRRSYGGWTRPRNEGLWGLGWAVTMAGFAAVAVAMVAVMIGGLIAGAVVGAVAVVVLAPMALRIEGRTGYERGILMFQWLRTVFRRENTYRGGVFSRIGTCRLPGLLAPSRLYEAIDSAGYRFGMIHQPEWDLYTVVLRCWPQGARAVDQQMIDQWVASWAQTLATLGGAPDVEAIVPVIDTVPETGNRLEAEASYLTSPDAPAMAREMMNELAATLPSNTVRLEAWCSVMLRATTPERRKDPAEQAVEIGRRLPGILGALGEAGVRARPMTADEVIALARRAFDPAAEPDLEQAAESESPHKLDWADAGPIACEEKRAYYWHDGVNSVTWEMSGAPEGNVDEQILKRLLEPNPDVPRKRVALVYRPHNAGDGAKIVDDDYKNALMAEGSARGVVSAGATLRVGATQQAREEQARGHGVTRFGALITVTTPSGTDLPRIDPVIKDLSAQARLKIRRSYCYQAAGFAAGLGLGVLLPEMATISSAVTE